MYLSTLCFICELVMALTNTWKFLIRQQKYKTWPLLMFYILTIWLAIMRIYNNFFFLFIITEKEIFGFLLETILKLNIGAVQCWILVEIGLRITLNIQLTRNHQQSFIQDELEPSRWQKSQRINVLISYGRCILMVAITLEVVSIFIFFCIETATLNYDGRTRLLEKWSNPFGWCFLSLSLVLFLSVYFLISRLRK